MRNELCSTASKRFIIYNMLQVWVSYDDEHRVYELTDKDADNVKDLLDHFGESNLEYVKDFLKDKKLIAYSKSGVPDLNDIYAPVTATKH